MCWIKCFFISCNSCMYHHFSLSFCFTSNLHLAFFYIFITVVNNEKKCDKVFQFSFSYAFWGLKKKNVTGYKIPLNSKRLFTTNLFSKNSYCSLQESKTLIFKHTKMDMWRSDTGRETNTYTERQKHYDVFYMCT